jgi:ATP-binding cassette subfamily B (MDR/TAP) protein 1
VDLKELRVQALRSIIGLVGQEPVLFNATIEENISCYRELSNKDLIEAATEANAHSFISQLPQVA